MDIFQLVSERIDMRSFSNLWYWIGLAVYWSSASHWILGVPFDLIQRARNEEGQAEHDMRVMIEVNCNRLTNIMEKSGTVMTGLTFFVVSGLGVLGFYYWVEFAQAVFFLVLPSALIGALSINFAKRIKKSEISALSMFLMLKRLRFYIQLIGIIFILITGMFGMFQNLTIGALS